LRGGKRYQLIRRRRVLNNFLKPRLAEVQIVRLRRCRKFLKQRMPEKGAHRARLKAWAKAELTKLKRTPGGGITKPVSTAGLAKTCRRMSMLRTVISEIDATQSSAA
jgi:hypothetical protein